MSELKTYFAEQLSRDDNLIGVGTGADGQTVVLVLDDSDTALAPHTLRAAEGVKFIKLAGPLSIGPPGWPEPASAPKDADPLDYINPRRRHRPFYGGVSIAHQSVTAGTVTGFFRDLSDGDTLVGSNNHVLADVNRAAIGSAILQPGPADGGVNPGDRVATLKRFERITDNAVVDFAVGKLLDLANADLNIVNIGYIHGIGKPYPGQKLIKFGRTTEWSIGDVVAIDAAVRVNYGTREYTIDECVITGVPSAPGDSGSPMLDRSSNALCAVLFAGGVTPDGYGITVGCEAENVMRELGIEPFPPPEIQRSMWLDVSHWQGAVNFETMKSRGVRGVIMKICQGGASIDDRFDEYYDAARAAGLLVGGYVYVDPDYSAAAHLVNLQAAVGARQFDLPITLDVEEGGNVTAMVQSLAAMVSAWDGRRVMIYTSVGFWNDHVNRWSGWKDYPLWIAYWSDTAMFPLLPADWQGVAGAPVMWQWRVFKGGGPYFGVSSPDIDQNTTFPSFEAILDEQEPPPPPEYVTLTITIQGSGSVSPGSGQYPRGEPITLQATPAQGWQFAEWLLELGTLETNPLTITPDVDAAITAVFVQSTGGPAVYTHNKGRVMISGLRIRTGPGTAHTITGSLQAGATVEILATAQDASRNTWARIGYNQWACMIYGAQIYIRYILEGE